MARIIKVASLFSGCGGGDLGLVGGFRYLGRHYAPMPFKLVFANDIYEHAARTHEANFGHVVSREDISRVSSSDIPDHNLLIGGFPCQAFSVVGLRRGLRDPRGRLFYEMVRILRDKGPEVFVAENVKGLLSIDSGRVYEIILDEFRKSGYRVTPRVVNAADYGVPQKRERVIIIGIREDLDKEFDFPEAPRSRTGATPNTSWVPLKNVVLPHKQVEHKYFFSRRALAGMQRANRAFNKGRAQDLGLPCNTLSTHLSKVSLNGTDPVLLVRPDVYRRFTPREAALIQSFPKSFRFYGSDGHVYKQIGNAIPPVMMWHISRAIVGQVFR
jgi:DNA (cytosine-5)-methyltransferase 1